MPSPISDPARGSGPELGLTLVETMIVVAITAVVMLMISQAVVVSTESGIAGAQETTSASTVGRLLERIESELRETTTARNHGQPVAPSLLGAVIGTESSAVYNWPLVQVGELHDTEARDGVEYWHTPIALRRFYIYATYAPFDTIEYQRLRVPTKSSQWANFISDVGAVDPWGPVRKILLEDRRVLLRLKDADAPGGVRTLVLATGIDSLEFHVDERDRIVVRVTSVIRLRDGRERRLGKTLNLAPRAKLD